MVTKFVPSPADSGGKQRSLAVVQELSKLGDVTLCAFADGASNAAALKDTGVRVLSVPWRPSTVKVARGLVRTGSISAARFWDPALARMVAEAARGRVDHLQIEYTQLSPYAEGIDAGRRFLDMHNVESTLAVSYASARSGVMRVPYRVEAAALRRMEQRATKTFDLTIVVSEADRRRLPPSTQAIVAPNGWNPTPAPLPPAQEPVAVFVALMGWPPNDDAALWLCRDIWPLVIRALPRARLVLAGRDPSPAVRACAGPNVHVTGTVPDVRPYLESAGVALAPLRAGGGSRLKVLEALDAGRPVVATTKGIEGLEDLVGDGAVVADDAESIAAAVTDLLNDPERATEIGRRGRAAIASRHAWPAVLEPLVTAVRAPHQRGGLT